MRKGVSSFI